MTVTFLDASTLAPADLDLSGLEAFGELSLHETTSPEEIAARCAGAEVIITNKVELDAGLIASCPQLKLILVAATGVNIVDLEAARAQGILVCNVAGYSTSSVAQHVMALLLALATNVHRYAAEAPAWADSPIFTRLDHPVVELAEKSFGIIGLGEIGSATARLAEALGMEVHVYGREGSSNTTRPELPRLPHDEFFARSDVISLHAPLTDRNRHIINRDSLSLMKPTALLLNASRGPLVDEEALAEALLDGRLAGAGLDVLSTEPPPAGHPLLRHPHLGTTLLITPHTAWISRESRQRLVDGLVANLDAFANGAPANVVNP
ncbi:MAG: D-2-hydroxyacid dehydrogenase [Akkermansiaceae bacterium]|nr:D-2-hydroxyacid dehydrogenase [Akkermansiaceae bacterium]